MTQRKSGALFQLHLRAGRRRPSRWLPTRRREPRPVARRLCALTTWLRAALWLHQTGVIINFIINFGVF